MPSIHLPHINRYAYSLRTPAGMELLTVSDTDNGLFATESKSRNRKETKETRNVMI